MSELLWFPNTQDTLVSISYSQNESALPPLDATLVEAEIQEMAAQAAAARKRRSSMKFLSGGGNELARTPPTGGKTVAMTTPAPSQPLATNIVTPLGVRSASRDNITQRTPVGGERLIKPVQRQQTVQTPQQPEEHVVPARLSSALKQARARMSTSPQNKENTVSPLPSFGEMQQQAQQSNSPAMMNMIQTEAQESMLSPLRFPVVEEVAKPEAGTKNRASFGLAISSSPLAVSLAETQQSAGSVPINWSTPVRSNQGRKSIQAPTSADPRVEAIKERVATLLKSKRKTAMMTPLVTPRPSIAPSETEPLVTPRPSVGSETAEPELTPYSSAVEQGLHEQLGERTEWTSNFNTPVQQPEPVTVTEEIVLSDAFPTGSVEATQSASNEMETVVEEEEHSVASNNFTGVDRTPEKPLSQSFHAPSPNTVTKAERAVFSRELIAGLAAVQEEEYVMDKQEMTGDKVFIAAVIVSPQETLEEKLRKKNAWSVKSIIAIVLTVMLALGVGAGAFFFTSQTHATSIEVPSAHISIVPHPEPLVIAPIIVEPLEQPIIVEESPAIEEQSIPITEVPVGIPLIVTVGVVTPIEQVAPPTEEVIPVVEAPIETIETAIIAVEEIMIDTIAVEQIAVDAIVSEEIIESATETVVSEELIVESDGEVISESADEVTQSWTWSPSSVEAEEDLFAAPYTAGAPVQEVLKVIIHPAVETAVTEVAPVVSVPVQVVESIIVEAPVSALAVVEPIMEVPIEEIIAPVEFITPVEQIIEVPEAIVQEITVIAEPIVEVAAAAEPIIEVVAEFIAEPVSTPGETAPIVVPTRSSWSTVWILTGLLSLCVVGGYLQSLEASSVVPAGSSGASATGKEKSPVQRTTSPGSSTPFSFTSSTSSDPLTSIAESTPTMAVSGRPSLSPIRPVRKIHFTPSSGERHGLASTPTSSSPAFASMTSRLDAAEPALQAVASALAHGAAKAARYIPANPSIGSPLLRVNTVAPAASEGDRLHVDVPMMIPPRATALVETTTTTKPVRASRRTTHQPAATLAVTSSESSAATAVEQRRSSRLSRRP